MVCQRWLVQSQRTLVRQRRFLTTPATTTSQNTNRGAFQSLIGTLLQSSQRLWKRKSETFVEPTTVQHPLLDYFGKIGAQPVEPPKHALEEELLVYMRSNQRHRVLQTYRKILSHQISLSTTTQSLLIRLLANHRRPFDAYRAWRNYPIHDDQYPHLLERVVDSLRYLDNIQDSNATERDFLRHMMHDIVQACQATPSTALYCVLLSSLLTQKRGYLARDYVPPIFATLWEHRQQWTNGYAKHILGLMRYPRRNELPFAQLLWYAVCERQQVLHASVVGQTIRHLYPYNNIHQVRYILESLKTIYQNPETRTMDYVLDDATIEALAFASAKSGSQENILLLWDLHEHINAIRKEDRPGLIGLYEATALVWVGHEDFWSLLQEIEDQYGISPALLMGLRSRWKHSFRQLERNWYRNYSDFTAGILVLLAGHAQHGNVDGLKNAWDEYRRRNAQPPLDAYAYVLEGLARKARSKGTVDHAPLLDWATKLLAELDDDQIAGAPPIVRSYIELLCATHQVDVAVDVVQACPVHAHTSIRVTKTLLETGDLERAQVMAQRIPEPMATMWQDKVAAAVAAAETADVLETVVELDAKEE